MGPSACSLHEGVDTVRVVQPSLWGLCACACARACMCSPLSVSIHVCGVLLLCKWYAMFKVGVVDVRVGCVALALCACVWASPREGRGRGGADPQSSQGQPN